MDKESRKTPFRPRFERGAGDTIGTFEERGKFDRVTGGIPFGDNADDTVGTFEERDKFGRGAGGNFFERGEESDWIDDFEWSDIRDRLCEKRQTEARDREDFRRLQRTSSEELDMQRNQGIDKKFSARARPDRKRKRSIPVSTALIIFAICLTVSAEAADKYDISLSPVPFSAQREEDETGMASFALDAFADEAVKLVDMYEQDERAGGEFVVDEAGAQEEQDDYERLIEGLEITEYDINYSQPDKSFARDGADVLMKLKNRGDKPVGRIEFTVQAGEALLEDISTGSQFFNGFGYAAPGETGLFYGKMHIADGSSGLQGEMIVTGAAEWESREDYVTVKGKVTAFNPENGAYTVKVRNKNSTAVRAKDSVIIAVQKDYEDLQHSWGAGTFADDIQPGEETVIRDVTYTPGLDSYPDSSYEVFVIEKTDLVSAD